MKDYMAPMEGITNYVYRNAYHACFHPMDKYFTPFITAKDNKRLSQKEENEISPEKNPGMTLVPQILANNAGDFLQLAHIFMDYGYEEINLNLGCPSGTVTAKKKGAGFLGEPEKLDAFLYQIFEKIKIRLSIKTRIGTDYLEEWESLLEIYNKYPLEELIVHPRLLIEHYKGTPHLNAFETACKLGKAPLCYNGNLFTAEDYQKIAKKFPETENFMYGRGLIANPGLVGEIREQKPMTKERLRDFHDRIYREYQETLFGDRNVLFRMKELWNHMAGSFQDSGNYAKKIKKAQKCREYDVIVDNLFRELELKVQ